MVMEYITERLRNTTCICPNTAVLALSKENSTYVVVETAPPRRKQVTKLHKEGGGVEKRFVASGIAAIIAKATPQPEKI